MRKQWISIMIKRFPDSVKNFTHTGIKEKQVSFMRERFADSQSESNAKEQKKKDSVNHPVSQMKEEWILVMFERFTDLLIGTVTDSVIHTLTDSMIRTLTD